MPGLMDLLKGLGTDRRPRQWTQHTGDLPWFDRPDALDVLNARRKAGRYDDEQCRLLEHWIEHGYVVVDGYVPESWIDEMLDDLDRLWTTETPVRGLTIEQIRLRPGDQPGVAHADLLRLAPEARMALRQEQRWRIHAWHKHSSAAKRIFQMDRLTNLCSVLFDRDARPCYSINFMYGSEQHLHQDTCVFHVHPMNYLIGLWLACEDVRPGCGALTFYPGSHKEPLFPRFDNYPQTNLKTCDKATTAAYNAYLTDVAARYERRLFMARKGQLLLWHGMLIHGGDGIANPTLTRKSYVCHYIPKGMNQERQVVGPFNW